jgi:hypothetical protein
MRRLTKRGGQIVLEEFELHPTETCMVCIHRDGGKCTKRTNDKGNPLKVKTSTPACELQEQDGIPF